MDKDEFSHLQPSRAPEATAPRLGISRHFRVIAEVTSFLAALCGIVGLLSTVFHLI